MKFSLNKYTEDIIRLFDSQPGEPALWGQNPNDWLIKSTIRIFEVKKQPKLLNKLINYVTIGKL